MYRGRESLSAKESSSTRCSASWCMMLWPTPSIAVAHCCFTSSSTVSPRRRPLAGCANWHWCRARAAAAGGAASSDYAPRPDAAQSALLRSPDMEDILIFSSWVSCSRSLLPRVASAHRRLLCRRARKSRPRLRCLCLGSEELHGLSSEMQICSWYCLVWLWTGCCHCSETPCQNVRLRYMVIRCLLTTLSLFFLCNWCRNWLLSVHFQHFIN